MKQLLLASAAVTLWLCADAQTTQTFNYTGAVQTFTVPPCVTMLHIEARGAQGGAVTVQSPFPQGGLGAVMSGDFAVTPGDVLSIIVGGRGNNDPSSSGGGGGSGVNLNGNALIVAGGGAGVDFQDPNYPGQHAVTTPNGVDGNNNSGSGGVSGGSGLDYMYTSTNISRGGNGWNAGNTGSTGTAGVSSNTTFTSGTWGLGGGGGSVGYGWCNCGGGGGGYSGGGSAYVNATGGGGGSYNSGTNQVNTSGISGGNTGDGVVIISYTPGLGVPPAPAGISGTSAVCEGNNLLTYFISPVANATGYTWSVSGNSSIISGQGTTSIDVQSGTGTAVISVTADNACGSSTAATFTLTIQPAPVVALGPDVTQCGGSVTLDAQNAGGTYFWSDASTNQTLNVTASGSYWVNVTDANGCGAYDTVDVTINSIPAVALGPDQEQCGGSVTLDAMNAGSTYLWSEGTTTQTLVVSASGTYSVAVTDANGCTGSDSVMVTINTVPTPTGTAPAAICIDDQLFQLSGTPAGGVWSGPGVTGNMLDPMAAGAGTHQLIYTVTDAMTSCTGMDTVSVFVDLCLGISSTGEINFSVSPNPNNGSFVIEFGSAQSNAAIELIDINGRSVQSNTVSGSRAVINCESQPAGIYFVRVTADGVSAMQKVIIAK